MRLTYVLLLVCSFTAYHAFCQQESFKIEGTVSGEYDGYVFLKYGKKTDSTKVIDQRFTFLGQVDNPTAARIIVKNGFFDGFFFLENSSMKLDLYIDDSSTSIAAINGNKTALLMADMMNYIEEIQSDEAFTDKLYVKLDTLISQNPDNQFSGMILSEIAMDPILSFEQIYSLYSKLDFDAQDKEDLLSMNVSMKKLKTIRIGTAFKDFILPDKNGNPIRSKDYRGSTVLVEIWSSWCGPCRRNNPELVRIYEQFHDEGFEIVGVSIDTKKEAWVQAVEKDGLKWPNTIAEQGWANDVIRSLGIQYVPSNYLIDKDGIILAINITPFELEKKLEKLFKN